MKLRRSFSSQQLIFALGLSLSLAALTGAHGQDRLVTRTNQVQQGKIVGVSNGTVQIQIGAGTIGIPLASVHSVAMEAPAEFATGKAAYEAGDSAKALASIKTVAEKFRGLPTPWAQEAAGLLGDIYVALNKLPEAEAAYVAFQKAYGGAGGSIQTDVGLARIAFSKKEYAKAKEKLEPITAKALEEKNPAPAAAASYSQAFFTLGQIQEAEQDYVSALENYLRTVTLFYHDKVAVAGAKERADALRKTHQVSVP